jgi:formate hydrogenlyase transcriptional activator
MNNKLRVLRGRMPGEQGETEETTLRRRLRFEEMLTDISARFMAVPFEKVDSEIDNALRQILEFFQVDRCALLEFPEGSAFARITHIAYGKGVAHVSSEINLAELFPWCYGQLTQGMPINISRVEDYPEDALTDRQSHEALGIKSALNIPVSFGGRVSRTIVVNHTHRHQAWPDEYIPRMRLLGETLVNALERRQDRLQLEDQLRFEMLLAEISGHFINLPVDRIDSEIEDAQRLICEHLGLDRSTLWQANEEEPGLMLLTHWHFPQGSTPPTGPMYANKFFPWLSQKVQNGETVIISKLAELPPEADQDMESLLAYDTKSSVLFPLSAGEGPVFGLLTFADMREERSWQKSAVIGLKLIAQVFANALNRKFTEQILRQSEERFRVTFEQAAVGIAHVSPDGNFLRINRKFCGIVGYSHEEILQLRFQDITYPDDLEADLKQVEDLLSGKIDTYSMEKRYIRKNGSLVWVNLTVALVRNEAGRPLWFVSIVDDIGDRKRAQQQLEDRSKFENLLIDISTRFINIPIDRLDGEINAVQKEICERLGIDRCVLWQFDREKPGTYVITHFYVSPSIQAELMKYDNSQVHFPWFMKRIMGKKPVILSRITDLPIEAAYDLEATRGAGVKSLAVFPLCVGAGAAFGSLAFNTLEEERDWPDELINTLKMVSQIFANALARKQMEEQLKDRLNEIEVLKQRLETENIYLREEVKLLVEHTDIIGQSTAIKRVMSQAEQVAKTDSTVFLLGETGTGKELLARAIHSMSARGDRTLVTVNCASLPPTLIESELFGREKGAYTGALTRMTGRFELADGSTLFLDEIGELPLELQGKLLRVLEQGQFERLGSSRTTKVNVRIIAATNRDIEQEVRDGRFRRDLFYRLNVFPIAIPPLRERSEDVPLLVRSVVKEFQKKMGKEIESIPKSTMQALQAYSWPGNVRELRNLIEHAMILSNGKTLTVHMPKRTSSDVDATGNLQDLERMHMLAVLEKTGWRIAGEGGAAEVLGLKRTTLQAKMKKLGITRSNKPMPN